VQARVFHTPAPEGHTFTDYVYFSPRMNRLKARFEATPDLKGIHLRFRAQSDGDMGTRFAQAMADVSQKHDLAIFWRSDVPCLPGGIFEQSLALFPQSVITLARGGGYAFLSLAAQKYSPAVFANVRWSTSSAGADQIRALKRAGVGVVVRGKVTAFRSEKDFTRILRELEAENRERDIRDLEETALKLSAYSSETGTK